jgi:hypothetical protein
VDRSQATKADRGRRRQIYVERRLADPPKLVAVRRDDQWHDGYLSAW